MQFFYKVLWCIFALGVNAFDGTAKRRRQYVSNVFDYNDFSDQQQQKEQQPRLGLFRDLWLASSNQKSQTAFPVPYNYETTHTVQSNESNDDGDGDNHNHLSNDPPKELYNEHSEFNNDDDEHIHNDDKRIPIVQSMVKKPKQRGRVRLMPMQEEHYHPVQYIPPKMHKTPSFSAEINPQPHHIVPNKYHYQNGVVPPIANAMDGGGSGTYILDDSFDQKPHTYVHRPVDNSNAAVAKPNSHSAANDDVNSDSDDNDDDDDIGGDELLQMMSEPVTNNHGGLLVGTKMLVAPAPAIEVYSSLDQQIRPNSNFDCRSMVFFLDSSPPKFGGRISCGNFAAHSRSC